MSQTAFFFLSFRQLRVQLPNNEVHPQRLEVDTLHVQRPSV